jgi:hypothetical protein
VAEVSVFFVTFVATKNALPEGKGCVAERKGIEGDVVMDWLRVPSMLCGFSKTEDTLWRRSF